MGAEVNRQITYITILKYAEEIKKLERNKPDSYIQEIYTLLLSFIKSEDFIPFMLINKENFFFNIFIMCEMGKENDKYIFIKILFPLLEELKKSKFEDQIWEINHKKKDDQKNILTSYYNKNQNTINEKLNINKNQKNPFELLKNIIKNKSEMFGNYLSRIINILFANEEIIKKSSKAPNIIDEAFMFFKPYFYDLKESKNYDIFKLVEYLMELYPSLEHIKEIYNITMFATFKAIYENEIKSIFSIYDKENKILKNIVNLKNNFNWFFYEEYGKKPTKVSGQIIIKKEQIGINIFAIINNDNKNEIMYGYICKSIFINYDIIMIEINLEHYKANKINLEKIKNDLENEIKRIKESNEGFKNLNTYIHVDKVVILYPQSYDLFLLKLLEKKMISNNELPEEYHRIFELSLKKNKAKIIPKKNKDMKEIINNKANSEGKNKKQKDKEKNEKDDRVNNKNNDKDNNEKKEKENNEKENNGYNDKENNKENDKENYEDNDNNNCKKFHYVNDNINEKQFIANNKKSQDIQNNINDSFQVNQLKEELEKEKFKNKDLSEKIKEFENKIIEENNKNQNLELKIKELDKKIIEENNKNQNLELKIKELDNKIIEENNNNQNLELKIQELNTEIDLLKEKYNKLKNLQEVRPKMPIDNSEIRDSLYESVFEKEKEIKELRLQLSRYPLPLNDGEKLMSLIFTSADQVIHHSVICKNNELFNKVENRLYEDGFLEYKESENFFTFNGLKINKNKSLDENNIKNSDIIILNVIEDD